MTNTVPYFQPLFDHMSQEHGLTLLDSEMNDICEVVMKLKGGQTRDEILKDIRSRFGTRSIIPNRDNPDTMEVPIRFELNFDHCLRIVTHRKESCLKYPDGSPVGFNTVLLWNATNEQMLEALNMVKSAAPETAP